MIKKSKVKNKNLKMPPIIARLNRVRGQLDGVKRMYVEDKCNCVEIIQQITAVRAALARISQLIVLDETNRCTESGDTKKLKEIINSTFHSI